MEKYHISFKLCFNFIQYTGIIVNNLRMYKFLNLLKFLCNHVFLFYEWQQKVKLEKEKKFVNICIE